jgi:hypothetical protein
MDSWQRCPVCLGEGKTRFETYFLAQICKVCKGSGILNKFTGLPPDAYKEVEPFTIKMDQNLPKEHELIDLESRRYKQKNHLNSPTATDLNSTDNKTDTIDGYK